MQIYLVASGDSRLSANRVCWPAQQEMERKLTQAFQSFGAEIHRAHPYDPVAQHGFIDGQRRGMQVFEHIPPDAPLVVAEAVWQYSHHVLAGLTTHRGPILTVANWSGQWPGLVGLLNLNASLTKAGIKFSTLWSESFDDAFFLDRLKTWLKSGVVVHDASHVRPLKASGLPKDALAIGADIASSIAKHKAILGVFDEGCMGMFNAIVPDHLLHRLGMFKERLSQSALFHETSLVSDDEARAALEWLTLRGMKFNFGTDHATELTEAQVLLQLKTYIAAVRMAADFGCDAIGIQYQQGLKDLLPASDLAEGLLNNSDRPPVLSRTGGEVLFAGKAIPHFNEVDECAGIDALITNRVWSALGYPPETTLHDIRYGEQFGDDYIWVLLISGAAPPAHFIGGYSGTSSERQPAMYFPSGGGTVKGVSHPGEIVWSRVFVENDQLCADLGRATVVELPAAETERRWKMTTPQWPIMHTRLHGVSRDQLMGRHRSNHIQVAYAPDAAGADRALAAKAACFHSLGIQCFLCGDTGL